MIRAVGEIATKYKLAWEQLGNASGGSREAWVRGTIRQITQPSEIEKSLNLAKGQLIFELSENWLLTNSGWIFKEVIEVHMNLAKYATIRGGTYIETPPHISPKAVINDSRMRTMNASSGLLCALLFHSLQNKNIG